MINFASDNFSPAHPNVLEWLKKVNVGPAPAYGKDLYTEQVQAEFKKQFGDQSESFLVWNGTSANVLGLSSVLRSYESILCSEYAHIAVDECGAPEKHLGSKLISIKSNDAKLTPESLEPYFYRVGDVHSSQPRVLSLTQSTEYGTLYSLEELRKLVQLAHSKNMFVHVDGSRLSNAAVSLGISFKEMITDSGVDILSFGGTKNGLLGAEAVVFPDGKLAKEFPFLRKQGLHLASKMRFLSAQFLAYFENDLWRVNATQANRMANLLSEKLKGTKAKVNHPVQANGVFASLPKEMVPVLQKKFQFYIWNEEKVEARLLCSFNTTEDEVLSFVKEVQSN